MSCWPSSLFNRHWCYSIRESWQTFVLQCRDKEGFFLDALFCVKISHSFSMPTFHSPLSSEVVRHHPISSAPRPDENLLNMDNANWHIHHFHFNIYFSFPVVVLWGMACISNLQSYSKHKMSMYMWGNEIRIFHTKTKTNSRAHNVYLNDCLFTMHRRAAAKTFWTSQWCDNF